MDKDVIKKTIRVDIWLSLNKPYKNCGWRLKVEQGSALINLTNADKVSEYAIYYIGGLNSVSI